MSSSQNRFWSRTIDHYPGTGQRIWLLVLSILATIGLYYQVFVLPSVFPLIFKSLGLSLTAFADAVIFTSLLGAVAAVIGGSLTDRFGRVNFVLVGLVVSAVISFLIATATSAIEFFILFVLLGFVEGIVLVASPALVRDFSPRLGRAAALGFWTVGPTGGQVVATLVFSLTYHIFGSWQSQYILAAVVALIISVICFFFLRDLSPQLRAQVMETTRETETLEARSKDVDVEAAMRNPWRQILRPALVFSVAAFSVSLLIFFAAQNYFTTYLNLIFKFSLADANALVSLFFFVGVIAAVLAGILSDLTLVRKPYILGGAVVALVSTLIFISRTGQPTTVVLMGAILVILSIGIGCYNVTWLAAFSETVEDINPALVGTGMGLYGSVIRVVVVLASLGFSLVVGNSGNWLAWWWICALGLVVFLPVVFTLHGYWTTKRSREAIREREAAEGLPVASGSV